MLEKLKKDMYAMKDEEIARVYSKFFKTGTGEYGEGDKFLGISVPETRKIAKKYNNLALDHIQKLGFI